MNNNIKVCHFTSLHNRYDTRVYIKQCCSLASYGYDVYLIVADGLGNEEKNKVKIKDIGRRQGGIKRLISTNKKILKMALSLGANYYFFHDPELCLQAKSLVKHGKKVFYDAHEDSPRQFLTNSKKNKWVSKFIASRIERLENSTVKNLSGVLTATKGIKERYDHFNSNVTVIRNFPIIAELSNNNSWESRKHQACYIGGLRNTRGIEEIVKACDKADLPLVIAGPWQPPSFGEEIIKLEEWKNVEYLGVISREEVQKLLANSKIGFLTLYKTPNHVHSLPIKLFEYMIGGIPFIASDIPDWIEIVDKYNCGICVDPKNVNEIVEAINLILANPEKSYHMGQGGKKAVNEGLSWDVEFQKIDALLG